MASGSSWSRYPPITRCAVTRDRRQRHDDGPSADVVVAGEGMPVTMSMVPRSLWLTAADGWIPRPSGDAE
jgi:hypothetical protein